jgi:hypothetical protein
MVIVDSVDKTEANKGAAIFPWRTFDSVVNIAHGSGLTADVDTSGCSVEILYPVAARSMRL